MFHRALIINLTVTEAILSALVLDALLSQLVMVADVCKALYSVQGADTQPRDGKAYYPSVCPPGPAQVSSAPHSPQK